MPNRRKFFKKELLYRKFNIMIFTYAFCPFYANIGSENLFFTNMIIIIFTLY